MARELVPVLADGLREYFSDGDLRELCGLFDSDIEWDHEKNIVDHLHLARRLILEIDQGNNRRILAAIMDSLFTRCQGKVSSTNWDRRVYHSNMAARLEQLRPLLAGDPLPAEITVPDNKPFTAKSAMREFLGSSQTDVLLVDAYVGPGTLDCLIDVAHPVRILTGDQPQSVPTGFEAAVKDFRAEGRTVTVRRHQKLHDRYVIFNDRCWLIGSSIKDAGRKALNVIECVDNKQDLVAAAEAKWNAAAGFL